MHRIRMTVVALTAAAAVGAVLAALPIFAQGGDYTPVLRNCPPCLSVVNQYVRADVDPTGKWVEGTTGGDPATTFDDNKRLLYGYAPSGQSLVGTGFTTVRVSAGAFVTDFIASSAVAQHSISDAGMCPPNCTASCPPECNVVVTAWEVDYPSGTVRITETLEAVENIFSGRPDVIQATYETHNLGTGTPSVGVRALLDVRVGDNDGAPYIIPGIGNLTREQEFSGDEVPSFWLAFESSTYEPDRLRAVGILDSEDLVKPDTFIVGRWGRMQFTRWGYPVDPTESVTSDSAVALYWDPTVLGPNQKRTVRTAYGVAGNRGGGAFLSSPVNADCTPFTVAVFVSNFDSTPLTAGSADLQLPAGFSLAPGESAQKSLPDIDPGNTASVAWLVAADPGTTGTFQLRAVATFAGDRVLEAQADIDVVCSAPTPTPTPTVTPTDPPSPTPPVTETATATPTEPATPTASVTATPTVPATPTATSTPVQPPTTTPSGNVCPFIIGRVPTQEINAAIAQPGSVYGWGMQCFPNRPPSPFNGLREWLSIRNIAVPYNRMHNPLVWKCGCP